MFSFLAPTTGGSDMEDSSVNLLENRADLLV